MKKWIGLLTAFTMMGSSVMGTVVRYTNANLVLGAAKEVQELFVEAGKIVGPQSHWDDEIDLQGGCVCPGFIDIQINGAFACDFSSEPADVERVARKLCRYGVTGFCPTMVTSSSEAYSESLGQLLPRKVEGGAEILGIHLEGPFIAVEKRGAHDPNQVIEVADIDPEDIYGSLHGVKIVTLAPELPGALNAIGALAANGVLPSMGHTAANYDQVASGAESGARLVTHLFNAMNPLHHRHPGVIGFVLGDRGCYYSLIVDGVHVDPAVVRMAWNSHPEGMILVTDAMAAMGLANGIYPLGNMEVEVQGGRACIAGTEVLAGSIITLDSAVRNLRAFTSCSLPEAVSCVTAKPAKLLNLPQKGHLRPGADADFVVMDQEMKILATYVAGECVWSNAYPAE